MKNRRVDGGRLMPRWQCWRCPRTFLHARYLTTHLMRVHGEPKEIS